LLNIKKSDFTKQSTMNIHYILRKNKVYVSKYGITKLIANSNEPITYDLQDYIYEMLYKLESRGVISVNDIKSREKIVDMINARDIDVISDKLITYKALKELGDETNAKKDEYINELRNTIQNLHYKIKDLDEKNTDLYDKITELEDNNKILLDSSKKLSRYVKLTGIKSINKSSGNGYESDDMTFSNEKVHRDAINAKKAFKNIKKSSNTFQYSVYYITRSVSNIIHDDSYMYNWNLHINEREAMGNSNADNYRAYKKNSIDYLVGDLLYSEYENILFNEIYLTKSNYNILSNLFETIKYMSNEQVQKILYSL